MERGDEAAVAEDEVLSGEQGEFFRLSSLLFFPFLSSSFLLLSLSRIFFAFSWNCFRRYF